MNTYAQYFDYWGFALVGFFLTLFVLLFIEILAKKGFDYRERLFFAAVFIVFSIATYLFSFTSILPFFPDTIKFAELVETGVFDTSALGVRLYMVISFPLRALAGNQLEVYLLFQAMIYFSALVFLWRGWQLHCQHQNISAGNFEIFILLGAFYPSALAFITVPLREFIQIFGFAVFLYGLSKYLYKREYSFLIIGAVITIFVRPQLIVVYPLMFLIVKQYSVIKLALLGLLSLPIVILGFEKVLGYQFTPSFFAYLRNSANENYAESGMTYGTVDWKTYLDVLIDLPVLMAQFMLSPLPIMHGRNPLELKFLMLDLIFILLVLWGSFALKIKYSATYIKLFFLIMAIFSIWEFYIGGAVRHRFPIVLMMLPLATLYYSTLLSELTPDKRKFFKKV